MKKQNLFKIGDKVRVMPYKKDKIIGEVIGVFYVVYPGNCISYRYDVLVEGAPYHLYKYPSVSSKDMDWYEEQKRNIQTKRIPEFDLKKVEVE